MTVFLLFKGVEFPFLIRQKDDLIVHNRLDSGNLVNFRNQVNRHNAIVNRHFRKGTDCRREADIIYINKTEYTALPVTHPDVFIIDLEISHGNIPVPEIHGEIAVNIFLCLSFAQETVLHTCIYKDILHLMELHHKVPPFLVIIRQKLILPVFLYDAKISRRFRVFTTVKEAEISVRQE